MMVPEGSSAKLICKARGFPKPKITWRREDGREIISRNGSHLKTKGIKYIFIYVLCCAFIHPILLFYFHTKLL